MAGEGGWCACGEKSISPVDTFQIRDCAHIGCSPSPPTSQSPLITARVEGMEWLRLANGGPYVLNTGIAIIFYPVS